MIKLFHWDINLETFWKNYMIQNWVKFVYRTTQHSIIWSKRVWGWCGICEHITPMKLSPPSVVQAGTGLDQEGSNYGHFTRQTISSKKFIDHFPGDWRLTILVTKLCYVASDDDKQFDTFVQRKWLCRLEIVEAKRTVLRVQNKWGSYDKGPTRHFLWSIFWYVDVCWTWRGFVERNVTKIRCIPPSFVSEVLPLTWGAFKELGKRVKWSFYEMLVMLHKSQLP